MTRVGNRLVQFLMSLPQKLSRVTAGGRFIPEIDGLRFLAILPVILQHASERMISRAPAEMAGADGPVAFMISRGTIGVFLFFAISGFILCLPFARMHLEEGKKVSLKKYFLRRITRLEPPYVIWMIVFAAVLWLKGTYTFSELIPHLGASLVYLHNLIFQTYTPINPVAWSLEIEIQFYLLAPLLAAAFFGIKDRARRRILTTLALFGFMGLQHSMGWIHAPYKLTILGQLQHFWIGFMLADDFLHELRHGVKTSWRWDIIGMVAFGTMMYTWSEEWGKSLIFSAALWAMLQAAFRSKLIRAFLQNPWITAMGGMCYTIYLIHLPLLELQMSITRSLIVFDSYLPNFLLQLCIGLPVILGLSAIFFLLMEKPCMDPGWPGKLIQWGKGLRSGFTKVPDSRSLTKKI